MSLIFFRNATDSVPRPSSASFFISALYCNTETLVSRLRGNDERLRSKGSRSSENLTESIHQTLSNQQRTCGGAAGRPPVMPERTTQRSASQRTNATHSPDVVQAMNSEPVSGQSRCTAGRRPALGIGQRLHQSSVRLNIWVYIYKLLANGQQPR